MRHLRVSSKKKKKKRCVYSWINCKLNLRLIPCRINSFQFLLKLNYLSLTIYNPDRLHIRFSYLFFRYLITLPKVNQLTEVEKNKKQNSLRSVTSLFRIHRAVEKCIVINVHFATINDLLVEFNLKLKNLRDYLRYSILTFV